MVIGTAAVQTTPTALVGGFGPECTVTTPPVVILTVKPDTLPQLMPIIASV